MRRLQYDVAGFALACAGICAAAEPEMTGGITGIYQTADSSRYDNALNASVDLNFNIPASDGNWLLRVETASSVSDSSVSGRLPASNHDAGSVTSADGSGRVQISELNYRIDFDGSQSVRLGLIDPAGLLDSSDVANDENSHFLGTSLVNNPVVRFPDYTLGAVWDVSLGTGRLRGMLTGSNGIGDNAGRSYRDLLSLTETGKGIFAAVEHHWSNTASDLRTGVWINGADFMDVGGGARTESDHGLYVSYDRHWAGAISLNARAGTANTAVSEFDRFLGLAVVQQRAGRPYGIGLTWRRGSSRADPAITQDVFHAETFATIRLSELITLTPFLQYYSDTDFAAAGSPAGWILSLRLRASW